MSVYNDRGTHLQSNRIHLYKMKWKKLLFALKFFSNSFCNANFNLTNKMRRKIKEWKISLGTKQDS